MVVKVSKISPVRQRREEEKEERRQQIIDAAEVVIQKVGWENTHFGEVAKAARLSRSLVYFYFKTRDELFHAVCGRGLQELERRFISVMAKHVTGLDQILAIGRAYYAFSRDCPLYFTMLSEYQAREAIDEDLSDIEQAANHQGRECLGRVAQALGLGLADRSIRPSIGEPARAAVTVWAFTHGLIQIASKKAVMLERDLAMTASDAMEHGFAMLRDSLARVPDKSTR